MRDSFKSIAIIVLAAALALAIGLGRRAATAAPAPVPVQLVGTTPSTTDDVNAVIACSATPPGTQIVAASPGRQAIALENLSGVTVCISKSLTLMAACPPTANATTGSWVLKASGAANDGSGGLLNFSQYSGSLACLSSSGTANVAVLSFAR